MTRTLLALSLLISTLRPAFAGVADSPIPAPFTQHVYSVPGVMRGAGNTMATFFSCANLEITASVQIGVEIFDVLGVAANDPAATALTVIPGQTVMFSSGPPIIGGIGANVYLGVFGSQFTARILATSKKIMCTAFVADPNNLPPSFMSYLPIIAKTKQKAAN